MFKAPPNGYLGPVVAKFIVRLPRAARGEVESLRKCKEVLDGVFRFTRAADPQRQALALLVLTQLFKIFFALDTPGLGRNLVRTVSQPGFPALDAFDLADHVCFCYYAGRLALLEDNSGTAMSNLQFVYCALPKDDVKRRRLVFEYLAPVRMTLGFKPDVDVLKKFNLKPLADVAQATLAGHGRLLTSLLEKNRLYFVRRGTYLVLCRLKLIASRQLLKACFKAMDGNNKIPLASVLPVFEKRDDFDPDEDAMEQLKCTLVNLIYEGFVRGYISHEHGVLVLSAKEPFPKTSAVMLSKRGE